MRYIPPMSGKRTGQSLVTFSDTTSFTGRLRFRESLCIRGQFTGTIEEGGDLIVDKGAVVEADIINVTSLSVHGKVVANVHASDTLDLFTGSEIKGDITAGRLRIADGVLFEGTCSMIHTKNDVEIFSRSIADIKADLLNKN